MEKFFVADSYKGAEIVGEPYLNDKGCLYINIKTKCPRCGGLGIIVSRVENDKMIPIPVDGGICYKCGGDKYIKQSVRAYTEKEYARMQRTNERARQRREEQREAEKRDRIENAASYKHEAAIKRGFNEDEKIFMVVGGDTYKIKDELKEMGARYNSNFNWYFTNPVENLPEGYSLCSISFDDVYDYTPASKWVEYKEDIKKIVRQAVSDSLGAPTTAFYPAEVKDRIRDIDARLAKIYSFEGMYGTTYVYTFESGNYVFIWMTSKDTELEVGDEVSITGTIKKFEEYNGVCNTYLTRCKVTLI